MRFPLNTVIVLLAKYWNAFGYCYIILDHPEMAENFLYSRFPHATNSSDIRPIGPAEISKNELQYFCFKFTRKDRYRLIENYEIMNDTAVTNLSTVSINDINVYFCRCDVRIRATTLQVKGIPNGVLAFQCAETAEKIVYAEYILTRHRFYIYEVTRKSAELRIQLVKYVPKVVWTVKRKLREVLKLQDPQARFALAKIEGVFVRENEFVYSQKFMDLLSRKSVCHIAGFQMFELCAVAHNVWKTFTPDDKKQVFLYEIRRPAPIVTCKRNVQITLLSPGLNGRMTNGLERYLCTDILPCAINAEWDTPSFYVARDQQFPTNVFIVEHIDLKYYATMRIRRVHPLDN